MFGKKTRVSIKNRRLTIFAEDALHPGVTTLPLDHALSGNFELAAQEGGLHALTFKPSGKKTADVVAQYADPGKAGKALETVFAKLNKGQNEGGPFWRIVKIILIIVIAVVVMQWLLTAYGFLLLSNENKAAQGGDSSAKLPLGEPIPVEDYIRQTQSATQGAQP